ncbi:TIGR04104 family putative zinc finger protein [Sporosarcina sp. FA9]|uniref:TIGR04104 family putative zinc finger protein n=1 Tax=Sporosarcina sp. FA9 TaxID=3413030 RepID=UPI003F65F14F
MPTCENCNNKWSWKQTLKITTTLNPELTCPYCKEKQFQTLKSKKKMAFLTPTVLLPLLLQIFFDIPRVIVFSLYFILFCIVMISYPFLVEVKSKEEYIGE